MSNNETRTGMTVGTTQTTTMGTTTRATKTGARRSLRAAIGGMALAIGLGAGAAQAQDLMPVNFSLDWAFQGPQAPFLLALQRGYFEEEGLDVTMDRGYGSGDVPVKVAAGTYDIGVADINPTIRLNAESADSDLVAVAVLLDASPLAAMTLAGNEIAEPADLEGKTLAAPDFDAGRQLFPAFAQATGIDQDSINWMTVTPQLRETMLATGEADAITGFLTSGVQSLKAAGIPEDDIIVMRYPDYGVDLYSTSVITTRSWAEENPDAVTGIIRAVVRGHLDAIADPDAAIAALKERDPLVDEEIERERMLLSFNALMLTDHVMENGFSAVDPTRMQQAIDMVKLSYGIDRPMTVEDVYSASYLPPREELMIPDDVAVPVE
jgi:NitT/TauT family transport system substrate-binding protein